MRPIALTETTDDKEIFHRRDAQGPSSTLQIRSLRPVPLIPWFRIWDHGIHGTGGSHGKKTMATVHAGICLSAFYFLLNRLQSERWIAAKQNRPGGNLRDHQRAD